jgi:hypothetical protein
MNESESIFVYFKQPFVSKTMSAGTVLPKDITAKAIPLFIYDALTFLAYILAIKVDKQTIDKCKGNFSKVERKVTCDQNGKEKYVEVGFVLPNGKYHIHKLKRTTSYVDGVKEGVDIHYPYDNAKQMFIYRNGYKKGLVTMIKDDILVMQYYCDQGRTYGPYKVFVDGEVCEYTGKKLAACCEESNEYATTYLLILLIISLSII